MHAALGPWLLSTAAGLLPFDSTPVSRAVCIAGARFGQSDDLGDGPQRDCEMFGEVLEAKGVSVSYVLSQPRSHVLSQPRSRHCVLNHLRTAFEKPSPGLNIIFFSGHGLAGNEDDGTRGALCVGSPPDYSHLRISELRTVASNRGVKLIGHRGHRKTYIDALNRAYLLTLDDIVEIWECVRGAAKGAKLLVVADSCYSGKLVARLRNRPVEGVAIQSAGNARQTVGQPRYVFTHAGIKYADVGRLTAYLTSSLHKEDARVRWSQEGQYPQFYATWDPEAAEKPSVALDLGTGFALRTVNRPDRR